MVCAQYHDRFMESQKSFQTRASWKSLLRIATFYQKSIPLSLRLYQLHGLALLVFGYGGFSSNLSFQIKKDSFQLFFFKLVFGPIYKKIVDMNPFRFEKINYC